MAVLCNHKAVKLAIIGGGAAGMYAAATAASRHLGTVLFERKARLGSKVLMTANGRCNFTKDIPAERFLSDLGDCAGFLRQAIRESPPRSIVKDIESLGVKTRRMADGRIFPADGKAATIVHAFGDYLRDEDVPVITNCAVEHIAKSKNYFIVSCRNFTLAAENVLIATGGVSYPKTGSVGDGQRIAHELGHRLVPYKPGLIGLETNDHRVTDRAPRRFEESRAKVQTLAGETLFEYRGEIDCEKFGLSGAAIYNCQRFIAHHELRNYKLEVAFDHEKFCLQNLSPRPVKEAIVTIGGVATDEIEPETMQSKLVEGLYFAGEVMDIDGPTGGYNLTLAFATARKAVTAIEAKELKAGNKRR